MAGAVVHVRDSHIYGWPVCACISYAKCILFGLHDTMSNAPYNLTYNISYNIPYNIHVSYNIPYNILQNIPYNMPHNIQHIY